MQFLPVSPTRTVLREIAYVLPDDRREMRATRYLNWRVNRQVNIEDKALIERVQAGMSSSSYGMGPLSVNEVALHPTEPVVASASSDGTLYMGELAE